MIGIPVSLGLSSGGCDDPKAQKTYCQCEVYVQLIVLLAVTWEYLLCANLLSHILAICALLNMYVILQ